MPITTGSYFEIWLGDWHCADAGTVRDVVPLLDIIFNPISLSCPNVVIRRRLLFDGSETPKTGFLPPAEIDKPPLYLSD